MAGSKLNSKEQEKANILKSAIMGKITNKHAAKQLRLSVRQIQRAKAGIRKNGESAVIHKLKGKPGNRQLIIPGENPTKLNVNMGGMTFLFWCDSLISIVDTSFTAC